MVLIECVGHVLLGLGRLQGAKLLIHQRPQCDRPTRAHDLGQGHRADGLGRRIHDDHVIELLGQIIRGTHEVDHLPNGPEGRRLDQFALHQPPGTVFRVGQRLGDRLTLDRIQRLEHLALLVLLEVLDQIDHVVRVEFPGRLGDLRRLEDLEHVVAHPLLQFRQDLVVDVLPDQVDDRAAGLEVDLFQQIRHVGDVQVVHQRLHRHAIARVGGFDDGGDGLVIQLVLVVALVFFGALRLEFGHGGPRLCIPR